MPPRPGAWDPVRDLQWMGKNVERFMKIWHCPKPVIGQIHGFAVGGATDLVLCCDQLFMAEDAYIGAYKEYAEKLDKIRFAGFTHVHEYAHPQYPWQKGSTETITNPKTARGQSR